jgi:hypothetical protein
MSAVAAGGISNGSNFFFLHETLRNFQEMK